ncbi:MAG: S8 family peptidase [Lacibacter sp.]
MKFYSINFQPGNSTGKKLTLFLVVLFMQFLIAAQPAAKKPVDKMSPLLSLQLKKEKTKGSHSYTIATTDLRQFKTLLSQNKSITLVSVYEPANLAVIECSWTELEKLLLNPIITAVDAKKKAKEELLFGFVDYAANKISTIQNRFSLLNGSIINISIKEQRFDTTDIDLKGRILPSSFAATTSSDHASIMATMMAGGGNAWYNTKGAAWGSNVSSASFLNLLPEPNSYYQSSAILVQNHSYGTEIENYYGPEAAGYDASAMNNNSLLHIFSAGNSGTATPNTGSYTGIAGYSNLTGNFKQAKNIITVGHIDSFGIVLVPSSKGPAYDGRVKPELVAFGEDGSSGATALVSGVAAVLHQTYKEKNNGTAAAASLIKAVLLNTADDVGPVGIDFQSGYGSMNACKAVNSILSGRYFQGAVSNNTQQQFSISIPAGIKQVKLTLVWTDPQASANVSKALVNDLDFELKQISNGTLWQPWVLNSAANISAIQQTPVRKRDSLNVVEQITVDNPAAGNYELTVKGFSIPSGTQKFSIAYQLDSADTFNWYFPTSSDHLFSDKTNVIRFESGFSTSTGLLEMSTDNGNSWQLISSTVDQAKGYYKLQTPALISKALLRMTINSEIFITDTFTISKRIVPSVGFNCIDSFLLIWPKVTEASSYRLSRLGNQYMESFFTTTDTFAVFPKSTNPVKYYSVTPFIGTKAAVRSYTFNYEKAGTECYIKNFFADLNLSNEGELTLEIGTTLRIKSIAFEKLTAAGFKQIDKTTAINTFQYYSLDKTIRPGSNIYRALIELINGQLIYSTDATIYFIGTDPLIVYPNPVQRNGSLTILSRLDDGLIFQLIDNYGKVVLQKKIIESPQQLSLYSLPKGIYYFRLLKQNQKQQSGKLIIH